jgi:hypothetical protein
MVKKEAMSWKKALLFGFIAALVFLILDLGSHLLNKNILGIDDFAKAVYALIVSVIIIKLFWQDIKKSQLSMIIVSILMWGWFFVTNINYAPVYSGGFIQTASLTTNMNPGEAFFGLPSWIWYVAHMVYYLIGLNIIKYLGK